MKSKIQILDLQWVLDKEKYGQASHPPSESGHNHRQLTFLVAISFNWRIPPEVMLNCNNSYINMAVKAFKSSSFAGQYRQNNRSKIAIWSQTMIATRRKLAENGCRMQALRKVCKAENNLCIYAKHTRYSSETIQELVSHALPIFSKLSIYLSH